MATQGKLDVLILGSGGREHALLKACLRSPRVAKVRVAPGNGGMALEAECLEVDAANPAAVLELVRRTASTFVIVGPEVPLAAGVVDALEAAGIPAYGPLAAGASERNVSEAAVGTLWRTMKSLLKALLASRRAPAASGP